MGLWGFEPTTSGYFLTGEEWWDHHHSDLSKREDTAKTNWNCNFNRTYEIIKHWIPGRLIFPKIEIWLLAAGKPHTRPLYGTAALTNLHLQWRPCEIFRTPEPGLCDGVQHPYFAGVLKFWTQGALHKVIRQRMSKVCTAWRPLGLRLSFTTVSWFQRVRKPNARDLNYVAPSLHAENSNKCDVCSLENSCETGS